MSLHEFAFPDGSINPLALLEQQIAVQAVTANDQPALQQLLDQSGGGTVLAFVYQPASWPPSWALSRQGNDLILSIAGTVNAQQWAGDVIGVYSIPFPGFLNRVHSFFLVNANTLGAQISAVLPSDVATCRFKIAGTSYGAAVALLIAIALMQRYAGLDVQLFQNASPKPLTIGYNGPLPRTLFVIRNEADVFPLVPPNGLLSSVLALAPLANFAITVGWRHYGKGVQIATNGAFAAKTPVWFDQSFAPGDLALTAVYHFLTSYMVSTAAQVNTYTNTAYANSVVALASQLISGVPTQRTVTNAGGMATISEPVQNVQVFEAEPDFPLTTQNLSAVQSGIVGLTGFSLSNSIFAQASEGNIMPLKVTYFYSVNLAGLSESWYVTGTDPNTYPIASIVSYLQQRLGISGQQTTLQWVRVSTVGTRNKVLIYTPADLFAAGLTTPTGTWGVGRTSYQYGGASDFGGTAFLMRRWNGSRFSRFFLRGIPDYMIENGGTYTPTPAYRTAVTNFIAACVALQLQWKGVTTGAIANNPTPLTAMTQNGDGTATITVNDPVFASFLGPPVSNAAVTIRGQIQPPYVNGQMTVQPLTATTARTLRALPVVNFIPGNGKVRVNIATTYTVVAAMEVERIVKRGPGRPFGLYRGRAKNRLVA